VLDIITTNATLEFELKYVGRVKGPVTRITDGEVVVGHLGSDEYWVIDRRAGTVRSPQMDAEMGIIRLWPSEQIRGAMEAIY
jgi:hypothetical protein